MSKFAVWISASRPRTLPAAIAPVLTGASLAWRDSSEFCWWAAFACLGFALLIQIATNFANDYFDFVKGADTAERVGPKRAVAAGLVSPRGMKRVTIAVFALAALLGCSLLLRGGWPLILIGLASVVCGIAYTGGPWPLAYKGLGDLFVFIFFGLVAVCGTYYVQLYEIGPDAWLGGAAIGALAVNILVANNYRDAETDAKAGKGTLVVRFGKRFSRCQFVFNHVLALLVFSRMAFLSGIGFAGYLSGCLLLILALRQSFCLFRAREAEELIRLLGACGRYLMLYSLAFVLLAAS